jgi:ribonucleoside-diphosphate reductase alpha chain
MGFADMLIRLSIPYDSEQAINIAKKVMQFISTQALAASVKLAKERGSFENLPVSIWPKRGVTVLRNATLTTIAPTGSISILAGTSSGIEPLFAISFMRNVLEGTRMLEVHQIFEEAAVQAQCFSRELAFQVAEKGSIKDLIYLPEKLRRLFVTSHDISPDWHVRMQAAFQRFTDNAVSKTVNLPASATPDDVRQVYLLAHKLKCKGITVYRYGSKDTQVLYKGSDITDREYFSVSSEYAGECSENYCPF